MMIVQIFKIICNQNRVRVRVRVVKFAAKAKRMKREITER